MNGVFAIEKPSGITSNQFMMKIQHLFNGSDIFSKEIARATAERMEQFRQQTGKIPSKRKLRKVSKVKMGHGGTLDPLASGVLVIGVGTGTKKLSEYLQGSVKVYESEALFGVSTTSGDVEGEILSENSVKHINMEELRSLKEKFEGDLKQTPPIFAALKMNGKPLHEYARQGIPLPRAIEPRQCKIIDLTFFPDCLTKDHPYPLLRPVTEESKDTVKNLNANMLHDTLYFSRQYCEKHGLTTEVAQIEDPMPLSDEEREEIDKLGDAYKAPLLHFRTEVSSGTYIRSLISDIGKAMRSSSYMVKLIRLQQKDWSLEKDNVFKFEDFSERNEAVWSKVLQAVFDNGSQVSIKEEIAKAEAEFLDDERKDSEGEPNEDINEERIDSKNEPTTLKSVATNNIESSSDKKRSIDEV